MVTHEEPQLERIDAGMKRVSVDKLTGGEKLAREIVNPQGIVLIPEGIIIKKEYIHKMKELHIQNVYIHETVKRDRIYELVIEEKIQMECKNIVKETIERYSYCANTELQEITKVADQIMQDILSEPKIMYNISCVRDKNEEAYSHSINVTALSVLVAINMKLAYNRVRDLAVGALLHDLGMVYLPFSYQNLIFTECSEERQKAIMKHVITGYSMIEDEAWIQTAGKEILLSHHERCDGSGYPLHLKGEHLRTEVKIVGLCDEFDNRVYGNLVPKQKIHHVIDYLLSEAGRKFDFNVVQKFIESVAAYPVGTVVRTNRGDVCMVEKQNYKMPTRPVLRVLDSEYTTEEYIDLVKELTIFIMDSIEE